MEQIMAEEYRPGISKLIERVARDNPSWSREVVVAHAKNLYGSPRIAVTRGGVTSEVRNPDYQAARDRGEHHFSADTGFQNS